MGILTSDRVRSFAGALVGSCILLPLLGAAPAAAQCPTAFLTAPDSPIPFVWEFGRSHAVDGDLLLVGAPGATGITLPSGAGYLYRLVAGEWIFEQKLASPLGEYLDGLGKSADLSGDLALLGAFYFSPFSGLGSGATVFRRSPSGSWFADGDLELSTSALLFPTWVAIEGDLAVTRLRGLQDNSGGIVAFRHNGSDAWDEITLPLPPLVQGMMFGVIGAIDDGVIAIGAPHGAYPATETGKVYLFTDQPGGVWSVDVIEGPPGSQLFGIELDLADSRLVVSTYDQEVHVYDYDGSGWQPAGIIDVVSGGTTLDVAVSGDEILVGDYTRDGSEEYCGVTVRYSRIAGTWVETATFESTTPSEAGGFGWNVSLDGPIAAVGSSLYSGFVETFSFVIVDCNGNGICDTTDIASGASLDADGNGEPDECSPFRRGDVNQSGSVNLADAVTALQYLFLFQPLACPRAADWNDDDILNIIDPVHGLGLLFANPGATPILPPYPGCGSDPTMGDLPCNWSGGC